MKQIIKAIKKAKSIAIFVHVSPDADCLGTASAFFYALKKIGKNVEVFSSDKIGYPYEKFSVFDSVCVGQTINSANYDLFMSVDVPTKKQLGDYGDVFVAFGNTICVDHHQTNEKYAKKVYVDSVAPATSEIAYYLIKKLKIKMDKQISDCLYIGIMGDTSCLLNCNATPSTLSVLSDLQKNGAGYRDIINTMFKSKTKKQIDIENFVYQNATFSGKWAYCKISYNDYMKYEMADYDLGSVVRVLMDIEGIQVASIIREVSPNVIKGSVRSGGLVNCIEIASKFTGGGHFCASGFKLEGNIDENAKLLESLLRKSTDGEQ